MILLRNLVIAFAALSAAGQTVSKATAEHYRWGDCCDGWYLVKNASLNVIEERMPPGTAETRHLHHRAQQFFFVLKGEATLQVNDRTIVIHEGEGAHVEPGVAHRIMNRSDHDLELLVTSQPPSHDDREDAPAK